MTSGINIWCVLKCRFKNKSDTKGPKQKYYKLTMAF